MSATNDKPNVNAVANQKHMQDMDACMVGLIVELKWNKPDDKSVLDHNYARLITEAEKLFAMYDSWIHNSTLHDTLAQGQAPVDNRPSSVLRAGVK